MLNQSYHFWTMLKNYIMQSEFWKICLKALIMPINQKKIEKRSNREFPDVIDSVWLETGRC